VRNQNVVRVKRVHFASHFGVYETSKNKISLDLFGSFLRQGKNEQATAGNIVLHYRKHTLNEIDVYIS
tara:strand:+ start:137 stop:340 length:204 start_codon:yes stop_codon:yes gene_type:complete